MTYRRRQRADYVGSPLTALVMLTYVQSHPTVGYILMSYFACMFLRVMFHIWRLPNTPLAIAQFIHIPLLIWLLTQGIV